MTPRPLDVLLINPPWTKKGGNIWKSVASVMPPPGIPAIPAPPAEEEKRGQ